MKDHREQWLGLAERCRRAAAQVPGGDFPQAAPLYPGDEWKEERYRAAEEDRSGTEVLLAFEQWRETGQWPSLGSSAAAFVQERLEWAARFAELLATPSSDYAAMEVGPRFPEQTLARPVIAWLAWDLYGRYHPARLARWSDRSQFD